MRRLVRERTQRELRLDLVEAFRRRVAEVVARDADAARLAKLLIGELEREDADRGSGLIETLTAYYASGARVDKTAEMLFLHRNSVRYRLDRIRLLTGVDIDRPEVVAAMMVALGCHSASPMGNIDAG